jgi:chemotaxis protein MotB
MAGGGGGAWKVAYADFVTAMMALFLVLWIISQDEQIKGNVQQYFRTRFASVTKQSVGIIPIENADLIRAKRAHFEKASAIPLEQVRRLNDDLVRAFVQNPEYIDMKTLRVQMTDEGLLIEFFNDPSKRLFKEGEAEMTEYGRVLFRIVAWTLAKHDSRNSTLVEVEGHTSKSFSSRREDEDEWDVSTDRAITVRKYMSEEGVKPDQFHKVTGYGNRRPLQDKLGDLDHPYHNRVSIMVRPRQGGS